jgi:hypothetical protein
VKEATATNGARSAGVVEAEPDSVRGATARGRSCGRRRRRARTAPGRRTWHRGSRRGRRSGILQMNSCRRCSRAGTERNGCVWSGRRMAGEEDTPAKNLARNDAQRACRDGQSGRVRGRESEETRSSAGLRCSCTRHRGHAQTR